MLPTSLLAVLPETQVPSQQLTQSKLPALHLDGGELHPGGQPWTRQETAPGVTTTLWRWSPLLRNELSINGEPGASTSVTAHLRQGLDSCPPFSTRDLMSFSLKWTQTRGAAWVSVSVTPPAGTLVKGISPPRLQFPHL